jgi:hypothetical protein
MHLLVGHFVDVNSKHKYIYIYMCMQCWNKNGQIADHHVTGMREAFLVGFVCIRTGSRHYDSNIVYGVRSTALLTSMDQFKHNRLAVLSFWQPFVCMITNPCSEANNSTEYIIYK